MSRQTRQPKPHSISWRGFTLAELLISLSILGVIATFTIPKILVAQQNQQKSAQAKEVMAMISTAYKKAQLDGITGPNMAPSALKPYLNYISDYPGLIDRYPTNLSMDCNSGGYSCVKLHTGGVLLFDWASFGGSATTNAINFVYDPDGNYSGSASGNSKSLVIFVYYSGRMSTFANINSGTINNATWPINPCISCEPTWFSWN